MIELQRRVNSRRGDWTQVSLQCLVRGCHVASGWDACVEGPENPISPLSGKLLASTEWWARELRRTLAASRGIITIWQGRGIVNWLENRCQDCDTIMSTLVSCISVANVQVHQPADFGPDSFELCPAPSKAQKLQRVESVAGLMRRLVRLVRLIVRWIA